jgi:hypothetical protein
MKTDVGRKLQARQQEDVSHGTPHLNVKKLVTLFV